MGIAIAVGLTVIAVGLMGLYGFSMYLKFQPQKKNHEMHEKFAEAQTSLKTVENRLARLEAAAGLGGMRR